jgi:2-dehydro-3-deoxyphosphogluconate aldolase / (4S)-4-hydroxy-2-oxoglutarate aldolase
MSALEEIRRAGVLAVLRAPSVEGAVRAADALVEGGITGIEVTYSTPDVPRVLASLADRHGDAIVLGAGTLTRADQAAEAVDAGARFLVSPGLDDDLVHAMLSTDVPALAGALTPTEVMRAIRLGVHAVKIFPGSLVGPGYLGALRGPFSDLAMMPTGGVSVENLGAWLSHGAIAVGVGGELVSAGAIAQGRWGEIRARAERFAEALRNARPD